MKNLFIATLLLSISLFLFTGCGREEPAQESLSGNAASRQAQESPSESSANGQTPESPSGTSAAQNGQTASTITQGNPLFTQKYIPLELDFPVSDSYVKRIVADSYGNKFYLLTGYSSIDDGTNIWHYALYLFDGDSQQLEQCPFTLGIPEADTCLVISMDVKGDNELSFRISRTDRDDDNDILAITDIEGNLLSLEESFPDGQSYPWNADFWDNRMVFDNQDGSTLLCEWDADREASSLVWFDREKQNRRLLGTLDGESVSSLCLPENDLLYYTADGNLILWDMAANTRKKLFRLSDIGAPPLADYTGLLCNSAGEVLICFVTNLKANVFVLSDKEPETEAEIRFAYLEEDLPGYSVKLATSFSYEHPGCQIKRENAYGGDLRDRIFTELAAGDGPELMWVSKEDMKLLAEKELLMDLTELIPPDIYEQLFPCVIQDCTINGRMAGIAPCFYLQTMAVPNTVWEGDSWSLTDLLSLTEARNDWELLVGNPYKLDGYRIFFQLLPGLADTPFLDLEQGTSNFNHQDFRRLLETALQYGGKTRSSNEEIYLGADTVDAFMRAGDCMTQLCYINQGLLDFSAALANYGDDIHITGYPSYGNSGHYMSNPNGYLAVSQKAEHLEEIREYISLLLDHDNQFLVTGCSARRDVERDKVVEDGYLGKPMLLMRGPYGEPAPGEMALKPDGTTYLEEYMAVLESAVPWPENAPQISAILKEELGAYFSGDKTLEDTIDIIQNRVQLYLDEG